VKTIVLSFRLPFDARDSSKRIVALKVPESFEFADYCRELRRTEPTAEQIQLSGLRTVGYVLSVGKGKF
jgi:hypothetical protein